MPAKRKVRKAKHSVKRKVRKAKHSVKKAKHSVKKAKRNVGKNNVNTVHVKRGYCEATILDENEPDDPCDIHKSENECETKDTEYWRSYKCNWKH
jgi:hypothetical protein